MNKNTDILRGEFIGKQINVIDRGIAGKIIDETKNSFLVKTKNDLKKRLLKQNLRFELKLQSGNVTIEGNSILMRPEDRIKIKQW
jgi:ribonuclease P protein subunit POP4|tara:strand:+ start:1497 stop:1751 length:255 start_codon:yes stop_codon:yes gene_type:complete